MASVKNPYSNSTVVEIFPKYYSFPIYLNPAKLSVIFSESQLIHIFKIIEHL